MAWPCPDRWQGPASPKRPSSVGSAILTGGFKGGPLTLRSLDDDGGFGSQLRWMTCGNGLNVEANTTGNGKVDFQIFVDYVTGFSAGDFLL